VGRVGGRSVGGASRPWDLLVVGGGTAGIVGARTAAVLGAAASAGRRVRTTTHAYPTYADATWSMAVADVRAGLSAPGARAVVGALVVLRRMWWARARPHGASPRRVGQRADHWQVGAPLSGVGGA